MTSHPPGRRRGFDLELGLGAGVAGTNGPLPHGPLPYPLVRFGVGFGQWTPSP